MIGVLMLETRFPRPVGDIGNPDTFDVPVAYEFVPLASPKRVVRGDPSALLPDFIAAGHRLVEQGAQVISTSCGFLTLFQDELSRTLPVPVFTSALLDVPRIQRGLPPGQTVGILTISKASLTSAHLSAAGVPADTPIGSPEDGHFSSTILGNAFSLDTEVARAENVQAALDLHKANPNLGALVLECTNMPPYADAISAATGLPVHSIVTSLRRIIHGRATARP